MASKRSFTALLFSMMLTGITASYCQSGNQADPVSVEIDGEKKFQRIDGFGVNANTRSWNGNKLKPAIDFLLDSMNATIWRVIVESVEKWEEVNDNDDPFTFNWDYYNTLYETPKFQNAWEMIRYLNQRGVNDKLMVNFMGFAPEWMGKKVIDTASEDEFVEMIVSFFHYAIKTRHLEIGLIAPTNESEHHNYSEGPHLTASQHARILRKIIERMQALGVLGNIRVVAPDNANTAKAIESFIPAMMQDPVIMSKVAHFGVHSYGGYHKGLSEFLGNSRYPESTWWVTEWNAWCNGCDDGKLGEYNYDFAARSVAFLLELLLNGAGAGIAWEGYDSYYEHHAPSVFSYWGFLAYEPQSKTYSPRKNFYAVQQVSRFVLPGSWRIDVSGAEEDFPVLAFLDSDGGRVSVVGINHRDRPVAFNALLKKFSAIRQMELYYTDHKRNLYKDADISVKNGSLQAAIPANCIFTLTGFAK